jgi:hypothetical protein
MLRSEERQVADVPYTTTQLPARRAIKVGTKLVRLLGPALGALGGSFDVEGAQLGESDVDFAPVLPSVVKMLVDQMDADNVIALILEILQTTRRKDLDSGKWEEVNKAEVFDRVYAGNFRELLGALRFALEVSLGDFFGESGITGLIERAKTAADRVISRSDSPEG